MLRINQLASANLYCRFSRPQPRMVKFNSIKTNQGIRKSTVSHPQPRAVVPAKPYISWPILSSLHEAGKSSSNTKGTTVMAQHLQSSSTRWRALCCSSPEQLEEAGAGSSCPARLGCCCLYSINGPCFSCHDRSGLLVFLNILLSLFICNWMELIKFLGEVHWNFLMRSCVNWPCHSQQRELLMTGFTFLSYLHIWIWRFVSNMWKNLTLTVLDPTLSL